MVGTVGRSSVSDRYSRWIDKISRVDDQVVDIGGVRGRRIKNGVQRLIHEKEDSSHERAKFREAADRSKCEVLPVANSAYTVFVVTLAAITELLELGQTF
jgi:5'(3')-deoxyribonucleotidase